MANTPSDMDHALMRRELVSGFSERIDRAQKDLLTRQISKLAVRIRERALGTQKEGQGTPEANMAFLLNATTYDIITDLTFGESANTLEQETDWISFVMPMIKARIASQLVTKHVSQPALRRANKTSIDKLNSSLPSLPQPIQIPKLFRSATIEFYQNNIDALDRRLSLSAD
jgi:hypothetical protein